MRRIALAVVLAVGLILEPLAVEAQPAAKTFHIGILGATPTAPALFEAFKQGLGQFGYTEGRNFIVDERHGEGGLLSQYAAELARLNVDVIFARGAAAVAAAQAVTRTIQVVAVDLESDPVAAGFVRGACAAGRQYHRGIPGFTGAERKTTAASQRGCSRWSSRHFSPRCRVMSYLPSVGNGAHEDE
jgi:ABC-type uncharacterized transport system substrate-binding protein